MEIVDISHSYYV